MTSGKIVALDSIRPKRIERTYRKHRFVVSFDMEAKTWTWEVYYVTTSVFRGNASSMTKALKEAEKHIDATLKVKGHE